MNNHEKQLAQVDRIASAILQGKKSISINGAQVSLPDGQTFGRDYQRRTEARQRAREIINQSK